MLDFLSTLNGSKENDRKEKARLEAFLTAFPGEYCGFSTDGSVAYSQGFADMLGLGDIKTIADIQNCLAPGDAAALEGLFNRLKSRRTAFSLTAKNSDSQKCYKISGSCGQDLAKEDHFYVLWIEDCTEEMKASEAYSETKTGDEERLKRLEESLNNIHRPVWLRDQEQKIFWVNKSYVESVGLPYEQILETQKELIAPPKRKKSGQQDQPHPGPEMAKTALENDKIESAKAHIIVKGERLLMNISEIPMKQMETTLGMALNITREEDLETELRRHQTSNKELLEQLGTAVAIYGTDQKLEFYNSAFSRLWGLEDRYLNSWPSLGDLMETLRAERRLPEQADFRSFKKSWLDMFTCLIEPFEDMLYLPDGSTLRMAVIPHSMGGLMMTFEDVTSRLELESSYNTLIAVQKETLDNLGEGVAVFGGDGRLKLWNPAYSRLWNLHPEDLEGEPHINKLAAKLEGFFEETEWEERKAEITSAAIDRVLHEGRYERSDGTLLDYSTVPLPDGGVLITYIDVTDTVRVEKALREKNIALETAEKLKLDFLANVSYQLRTPLNTIMGFNEILDQEYFGPLNARQKEYTRDMKNAGEKLLTLINDILDLSTIEAGQMQLNIEEFKLRPMLENLTELVSEWARKQGLKVEFTCPKNIGSIKADPQRIKQAIINLIRNAINFTPENGEITIKASKKDGAAILTVSDTGIGMSEDEQSRIFEPFERATSNETLPEHKQGAGLGLTLVRNIAELHNGHIKIQSAPNKGTSISMILPMEEVKTNETAKKQTA